jgi:uncharacterized protein YdeI (YjbR/CyaY-like superfamily)
MLALTILPMGRMTTKTVHFSRPEEFRKWLVKNHAAATELFVGFHKKSSGKKGATYSEALDEALCFGWIDGVRRSIDSESYLIRFTPRKPKSIWSLVNVRHVKRLQKAGKMAEPGLKAFAAREKHRTGIYSFEQKRPGLSAKFNKLFRANAPAWEFFAEQAPWYQRTSGHWVVRAKQQETRMRRFAKLVEVSANRRRLDQLTPKAPRKSGTQS